MEGEVPGELCPEVRGQPLDGGGAGFAEGGRAAVVGRGRVTTGTHLIEAPLKGVVPVGVHAYGAVAVDAPVLPPDAATTGVGDFVVDESIDVHQGDDVQLPMVDEARQLRVHAVSFAQPFDQPDARLHGDGLASVMSSVDHHRGFVLADLRVVGDLPHPDVTPLEGEAQGDLRRDQVGMEGLELVHGRDHLLVCVVPAHGTLPEGGRPRPSRRCLEPRGVALLHVPVDDPRFESQGLEPRERLRVTEDAGLGGRADHVERSALEALHVLFPRQRDRNFEGLRRGERRGAPHRAE